VDETVEKDTDSHRFKVGEGVYRDDHTSLLERVTDAWKDMQSSTRRLIDEKPSEGRLLFFVLMSDLMFFLSWSIKTVVDPDSIISSVMPKDVALLLVGALLLRTGSVYVFSYIVGFLLKALGGKGSLKDTRCGIFWGAFVAAPFGVLAGMLAFFMNATSDNIPLFKNEFIELAPLWLGLLPYVWYVSAGATEAHGFKRVFPLFAGLSLMFIFGLLGAMYLRARGVF